MMRNQRISPIKIHPHQPLGVLYSPVSSAEDHSPLYRDRGVSDSTTSRSGWTPQTPLKSLMNLLKPSVNMSVKLTRIQKATSPTEQKKKKRIRNNTSVKDWWVWYWQAPKARFPFLYFTLIFVSCVPLIMYWFMDNDSSFILCGLIGLTMFGYGAYKFNISISLKKEIDQFTRLNAELKKENRLFEASIQRMTNASNVLRETRARLSIANDKNRENLKKFEQVEYNMTFVSKKAKTNLNEVNAITQEIREKWRHELLDNENTMLHTVFLRYERTHTNKSRLGLTEQDFEEFQGMLPPRYSKRFKRMGTFNAFAGGKEQIDRDDFVNTLDTFAMMETDGKDLQFLLTPTVGRSPDVASFRFETIWKSPYSDLRGASMSSVLSTPPSNTRSNHLSVDFK
eukprot:441956_1